VIHRLLADSVLLLHFGFILFALLGGLLALRWRWAPWLHIPAALWGAAVELSGRVCPLTPLENRLRRAAGASGYEEGFIEHYLLPLVYPAELTRDLQLALALILLAVNVAIYAMVWRRRRRAGGPSSHPMEGEGRSQAGWVGRASLLLVLALVVAAAYAVQSRRSLAEYLILRQLRETGVADASLSVTEIGPRAAAFRDLRLGDGDLELRELDLGYSAAGLVAGRLDSLRAGGLRVRGRVSGGEVGFGALDAFRAKSAAGAASARPTRVPALPAGRIQVEDATLHLDTDEGSFEASLSVELDEEGRGPVWFRAGELSALDTALGIDAESFAVAGRVWFGPEHLELELDPAPFALVLAGEASPLRVAGVTPRIQLRTLPDAGEALALEASGGELRLPDLGLEAKDVRVELRLDPETSLPTGSLAVGRILDRSPERRFQPLRLETRLTPGDGALGFEGELTGVDGRLEVHLRGLHDPTRGTGRAELHLDPLRFEEEGLGPGDLFPLARTLISSASGSVEAHAEVAWDAAGVIGFVDFGLRGLALETAAARFEQVNAVVRVDGPWPLRVPKGQLVSMARVDFGLELTNGLVRFGVQQDGVVELESAAWSFAGGTIRTRGTVDLFAEERDILLTVEGVDLAQLLALVNLDGLSGDGRLDGRLPLTLGKRGLLVHDGRLEASEEGGWIRYRPQGGAAALGAVGEMALDDLLLALADFHYDGLSLAIDGSAQDAIVVKISLSGANPQHRDGQPYNLNLSVDGRLGDLIRQGTAAYEVPERIEERLNEIAGGRR
jgi:hypothetical protein